MGQRFRCTGILIKAERVASWQCRIKGEQCHELPQCCIKEVSVGWRSLAPAYVIDPLSNWTKLLLLWTGFAPSGAWLLLDLRIWICSFRSLAPSGAWLLIGTIRDIQRSVCVCVTHVCLCVHIMFSMPASRNINMHLLFLLKRLHEKSLDENHISWHDRSHILFEIS